MLTTIIKTDNETIKLKQNLTCQNYGIYAAKCIICNTKYIGQTKTKFSTRWRAYRTKGLIPFVKLYKKIKKNSIHNLPAWHSAFRRCCGKKSAISLVVRWARHLTGRPYLYMKDRWPRNLGNGNHQASAEVLSQI